MSYIMNKMFAINIIMKQKNKPKRNILSLIIDVYINIYKLSVNTPYSPFLIGITQEQVIKFLKETDNQVFHHRARIFLVLKPRYPLITKRQLLFLEGKTSAPEVVNLHVLYYPQFSHYNLTELRRKCNTNYSFYPYIIRWRDVMIRSDEYDNCLIGSVVY